MKTKKIILSGLFAAIVAILAQISIPIPFSPVPVTGQFFAVFLTGALLGSKWGAISMAIYLLLGAVGIPVFHAAQGGLQILVGPTGGYLFGFIGGVYLQGKLTENKAEVTYTRLVISMITCMVISYALGTLQLALIAGFNLPQALMAGVVPFLPLDLLKIFGAAAIALPVRRSLIQGSLL
ncbi:MAG: biotin transporter BioY [Dethiobacteria bacterium]|jgi:biotin transport system substrate-specific component